MQFNVVELPTREEKVKQIIITIQLISISKARHNNCNRNEVIITTPIC